LLGEMKIYDDLLSSHVDVYHECCGSESQVDKVYL
jgi:hypothetical protein